MGFNYGKQWEQKVKEDFSKIDNSCFIRFYDQVSGYKTVSKNICDYLFYKYPYLFLIECKSVSGNTFNFSNLRQFDLMKDYCDIEGVIAGVLIWYVDHHKVVWAPIKSIIDMKNDGVKSINANKLDDTILEIPSITKKLYPTCDYMYLYNYYK